LRVAEHDRQCEIAKGQHFTVGSLINSSLESLLIRLLAIAFDVCVHLTFLSLRIFLQEICGRGEDVDRDKIHFQFGEIKVINFAMKTINRSRDIECSHQDGIVKFAKAGMFPKFGKRQDLACAGQCKCAPGPCIAPSLVKIG
jgi:hypothetical protein